MRLHRFGIGGEEGYTEGVTWAKIKAWLRRGSLPLYVWLITAALTVVCGLLGLQGKNSGVVWYKILQFFFLNGNPDDLDNTLTEVAAFCGAVSSLVGLFAIFIQAFHDQVRVLRLRFFCRQPHTIFVGLGTKSVVLARVLKTSGLKVAIDPLRDTPEQEDFVGKGGLVIHGSGTDDLTWSKLRVRRAERIYVLAGDDQINADIAQTLRNLYGDDTPPIYTAYADPLFAIALSESHLHRRGLEPVAQSVLEATSTADEIYRLACHEGQIWRTETNAGDAVNIPLKAYERFWNQRAEDERKHAMLVGEGHPLEAAIIEWCNLHAGTEDCRLCVVAPRAKAVIQRLKEWHGSCRAAERLLIPLDVDLAGAPSFCLSARADELQRVRLVHVTSEDDAANLRLAVVVQNANPRDLSSARFSFAVRKSFGLCDLAGGDTKKGHMRGVVAVNLYELAAGTLVDPQTELGRIVESCYRANGGKAQDLQGPDRAASLEQAELFIEAMQLRGFHFSRIVGDSVELSDEDKEFILEREHERWRIKALCRGLRFGPERTSTTRNTLLPWSPRWSLHDAGLGANQVYSEDEDFQRYCQAMKRNDREAFDQMLANLRKQGIALARLA